jgi:hypothetical protein
MDTAAISSLNVNGFPLKIIEFSLLAHTFAPASHKAVLGRSTLFEMIGGIWIYSEEIQHLQRDAMRGDAERGLHKREGTNRAKSGRSSRSSREISSKRVILLSWRAGEKCRQVKPHSKPMSRWNSLLYA